MKAAELLLGLAVAGLTLRDVFDTVVVPGGSRTTLHATRRIVFLLLPVWKKKRGQRRGLSTMFAPLVLVAAFATWMILLALGFGLMAHALRDEFTPPLRGFGESVFAVATSLVTVGDGHAQPLGWARWVVVGAGFCGLAVMTMAVTYLLEVQSSISRRDKGIFKLRTSSGEPPSAVGLLEKYARIGAVGELGHVLSDGRDWCVTVLQSHASHPSLIYFRTVGTGAGWPAALGALLDLALIVEHWLDDERLKGRAVLLREDGVRMAEQIAGLIDIEPAERFSDPPGEIAAMEERLQAHGYRRRAGFDAEGFMAEREAHRRWTRALADHLGRPDAPLLPEAWDGP